MENRSKPDQVYERYVDAAVDLFMQYYFETIHVDSEADITEQQTAELSKKCESLVKAKHRRKKLMGAAKGTLKVLKAAAILAVVVLSASSFLFVTVEAVRKPILDFYIEYNDGYVEISGDLPEYDPENPRFTRPDAEFDPEDPLGAILAHENFSLERNSRSFEKGTTAIYRNDQGDVISIQSFGSDGNLQINTENLRVEYIEISGQDAILTSDKHTRNVALYWYYPELDMFLTLHTDYYPENDVIDIAEILSDMLDSWCTE